MMFINICDLFFLFIPIFEALNQPKKTKSKSDSKTVIDLDSDDAVNNIDFILAYISLVCFNQFQKPRKKLDGAISLSFNLDEIQTFGQIDEEILSKEFPKTWGKIEIGSYSYQLSRGVGADHFSLKSK